MAWLMFISTCICFFFNVSIHVSAEMIENLYDNPDFNMAMQKIEEMYLLIRKQGEHIILLEQRNIESQNIAKKQNDRIVQLEARIQELETGFKAEEDTSENSGKELSSKIFVTPLRKFIRKGIYVLNGIPNIFICYIHGILLMRTVLKS